MFKSHTNNRINAETGYHLLFRRDRMESRIELSQCRLSHLKKDPRRDIAKEISKSIYDYSVLSLVASIYLCRQRPSTQPTLSSMGQHSRIPRYMSPLKILTPFTCYTLLPYLAEVFPRW
ncbi:hypothetical protein EYC80_008957 [Monilinia laxa]|uniref:Uncharacterized protein n=1 Tax=Monilinia laxa TaxID=61186 RepID=A0A5N6K226_MONLA|nr:hypothetical protein EYC80_008957 [Monilinia laxa]